jgi:hypothetical protein
MIYKARDYIRHLTITIISSFLEFFPDEANIGPAQLPQVWIKSRNIRFLMISNRYILTDFDETRNKPPIQTLLNI